MRITKRARSASIARKKRTVVSGVRIVGPGRVRDGAVGIRDVGQVVYLAGIDVCEVV